MCDIRAKLYNLGKQILLCKVAAQIGNKGNEEADKAAKQAIDMVGMNTSRLIYILYRLYCLTIRRTRNFK